MRRFLLTFLLLTLACPYPSDAIVVAHSFARGSASSGLVYYTDNFDRADANPIGGNWVTPSSSNTTQIISNQAAKSGGSSAEATAYYNATFNSNQYSQCTIPVIEDGGPVVRVQPGAAKNLYGLSVMPNNITVIVYIIVDEVFTQLGADINGTFGTSDVFRLEASGSTLTVKQNGSVIGTRTDTTFTGGNPGIEIAGSTRLDDWTGGDL